MKNSLKLLSPEDLKIQCPFKWHDEIPVNGISLGIADVDFEGPEGISDYIKDRMRGSFSFYQSQIGMHNGLDAIEQFFHKKKILIEPDNLQIIPGTMIGIYAAMKYISKIKGKIITLGPIYEPIHKHATDNNNQIDWFAIGDKLDIDGLNTSIDSNTKMLAICNPTNPVGYSYSKAEIKGIQDLVVDNELICFSDELYEPLVFANDQQTVLQFEELKQRSIVLYGFSKAYGLAGYRSGFIHAGNDIIEDIRGITNSLLVSPSPIASIVCEYALLDPRAREWINEFRDLMHKNTQIAAEMFNENGYPCGIPDSCFFVFPDLENDDMEFASKLLSNQGVQVIEGSKFGPQGKNHVRINCGTSSERLRAGIEKILDELALS